MAELRWYQPPGPAWAVALLDALASAGVRFPPRLLLFRKAFLTLQGVLSDVCPACSLEATLVAEALVQLAWEWPVRWWKPLDDRDYATHVSTADLMHLALRFTRPLQGGPWHDGADQLAAGGVAQRQQPTAERVEEAIAGRLPRFRAVDPGGEGVVGDLLEQPVGFGAAGSLQFGG